MTKTPAAELKTLHAAARLPRTVWGLGLTSLFMDLSSEMIHALLPVYLTVTLGLSAAYLGWVEGLAEATALAVRVVSGRVSDMFGKRKELALLGYGLAAAVKPIFPLAANAPEIIAARVLDRLGKGLRGAPRDALVADVTAPAQRGAAYGLRQALDTVGAVLGPLAAIGLMLASGDDVRFVFWIACLPALLCVLVLAFLVEEPAGTHPPKRARAPLLAGFDKLPPAFWLVLAFGALLTFARVSEAFLVLRATGGGLPAAFAPLVLVSMSFVAAFAAYPAGRIIDRWGAKRLLALSAASLALSEAVLGAAEGLATTFLGIALWGGHIALTQVLFSTLTARTAPRRLRATAFGVYGFATAAAIVAGNVIFGALADYKGLGFAYGAAAVAALAPLALLAVPARRRGKRIRARR